MSDNRDSIEEGLQHEFSDLGGHVNWTGQEFLDPISADAAAVATCAPDLIRWVLEHKGINIAQGDMTVGHKTVNNWKKVYGVKIPLPNTYFGYAGWKP
jgi:hypothetical protein